METEFLHSRVAGIFSSPPRLAQLWGARSFLCYAYRGSFFKLKLTEREIDHSPSSSVEVKNAWNFASTSLICLMTWYLSTWTILTFAFAGSYGRWRPKIWNEFNWFRILSNAKFLWKRRWTFGFHKRLEFFWHAEWLSKAEETLCTMELVC